MSAAKAVEHYMGMNGRKRLNCAQSVVAGLAGEDPTFNDTISSFASCGGGKAPEGICGALHAARHLLGSDAETSRKCESEFILAAGSAKCREIRSLKKLSCRECVFKAAELVEKARKND